MEKTCKVRLCFTSDLCGKETVDGTDYCKEHLGMKCPCGNQMTQYCDDFAGSWVCGVPMCNNCSHKHR